MGKLISVLLLVLLLAFKNEEVKYRVNDFDLKGKVKSILTDTKCVYAKGGCINAGQFHKFDENGYETDAYFTRDGKVISIDTYEYSKKRDTLTIIYTEGKTVCIYLPNGKLYEQVQYIKKNDGWVKGEDSYRYLYTEFESQKFTYKNGKTLNEIVYTYDKKNKKLLEEKTMMNGEVLAKISYKYDSDGNCEKLVSWHKDAELNSTQTFTYDDKGSVIEERMEAAKDHKEKWTSEYKYDATGNWVELRLLHDNMIWSLTTREIEYY